MAESTVQAQIRLAAPHDNVLLFRNNTGVLMDKRGIPVRFGLANDSAAVNKQFKSSDLVGLRWDGLFVAIEVKEPGARTDPERLAAQERFIQLIRTYGGRAGFAASVAEARAIWLT